MEGFGPSYDEACDDYLLSLRAAGYSPTTIKDRRNLLSRFRRQGGRLSAAPSDITAFLASLRVTRNVLAQYLGTLRLFFEHCVDNAWLPSNPAKALPRPRHMQRPIYPVPLDDLTRALQVATDRQRAIVITLVTTGLRLHELASLLEPDIDWQRARATVRSGKGDKQRIVALPRAEMLRPWIGRLTQRIIVREIEQLQRCSSVRIRAHLLRHTFAVECRRNGMPLEHLQRLLGHASISTTMIYLAYESQEEALEAQRRCAPLTGGV